MRNRRGKAALRSAISRGGVNERVIAEALFDHRSESSCLHSRLRVHMVSNPCSALEFTSLGGRLFGQMDRICKHMPTCQDLSEFGECLDDKALIDLPDSREPQFAELHVPNPGPVARVSRQTLPIYTLVAARAFLPFVDECAANWWRTSANFSVTDK